MYVLFEEAGKFMAGRVLSEAEASAQVELDSGKRVKVKAANILIKFEKPAPAELMAQAAAVAQTIELELAWEFAPEDEFGFADLARDYFSADATLAQQAGALFRLFEAPHYFRRAGKGRFKKAPAEILQQALAAIEKKKQSSCSRSPTGSAELGAGRCPRRSASSSSRSCSSPTRTRPNTRPWSRPRAPRTCRRWTLLQQGRRHRLALPVPLAALPARQLSQGHGFPAAAGAAHHRRAAAGAGAGLSRSTTRRPPRSTTRCRCRAWAAAPWCWASTSPRRAWRCSRAARSTRWAAQPPVHGLHAGLQDHHAARRRGAGLHAARRAATARRCRCTSRWTKPRWRSRARETKLERVPIAANLRHDQLDAVVTRRMAAKTRRLSMKLTRSPAPIDA